MPDNTFRGANMDFNNLAIHFLLNEIITFRKQLTARDEKNSQSGWDDALNAYMREGIEKFNDTIKRSVYNPDDLGKDAAEAMAADTTLNVVDGFNERSIRTDNVVMPSGPSRKVIWDLTGSNLDIPQLDQNNCPNDFLRSFVTMLDHIFVQATRLDSRSNYITFNKSEGRMLLNMLNVLYTITQTKGGEVNRFDIANGTLPSQESGTFQGV